MTSKEIIENELKFLKHNLEKAKKEKVVIAIKQIEREIKRKEQVLKDLEEKEKQDKILEILKETIKNNVFDVAMLDDRPNGETLLSCDDFGIKLKTEDYRKIVGWKNDK